MTMTDLCIFIFGLSGCFWMTYGLYVAVRIQWFIVKRYEIETDLMDTLFFQKHATFTRAVPSFFSSAMYTSHLLMCMWGWRMFRNKKVFRDVDNPSKVISHFSKDELSKIKMYGISCILIAIHGLAFYILRYFRPEIYG